MKNHNFYREMVAANEYIKSLPHLSIEFELLAKQLRNKDYMHSDRWSIAYDFFSEQNLDTDHVTGFVYNIEEGIL